MHSPELVKRDLTRAFAALAGEAYEAARQEAESIENRLFGWVGPRKPHELGADGFRATEARQGISEMHGQSQALEQADASPGGALSETS
jgi:hypothetical protein